MPTFVSAPAPFVPLMLPRTRELLLVTSAFAPTAVALVTTYDELRNRAEHLAAALTGAGHDAVAVETEASVGGGGAPGVILRSAAVSLPEAYAVGLRSHRHAVLGRIRAGRCLLDLYAVPPGEDPALLDAVLTWHT